MENKFNKRDIALIPILAAIAIVLGLIEIPWPFGYIPGLKLDFSDVLTVVVISMFGFKKSVLVLLIKSIARVLILRLSTSTGAGALGGIFEEFMATFASFMYIFAFLLIDRILKKRKGNIFMAIKSIFIAVFVALTMLLFNYLYSTPFYLYFTIPGATNLHWSVFTWVNDSFYIDAVGKAFGFDLNLLSFFIFCVATYIPFNFVKAAAVIIVSNLTIPSLEVILPSITKYRKQKNQEKAEKDEQLESEK